MSNPQNDYKTKTIRTDLPAGVDVAAALPPPIAAMLASYLRPVVIIKRESREFEYRGQIDPETGEANGFGKEYFRPLEFVNNELHCAKIYEGEFKNDKRHGKGIEYLRNGSIEYEGDWKDGKRHGKGIEYRKHPLVYYEGDWKDGEHDGKGCLLYTSDAADE